MDGPPMMVAFCELYLVFCYDFNVRLWLTYVRDLL